MTVSPEWRAHYAALKTLKSELERLLADTSEGVKPVALDQPIGRLSRIDAIQQQKLAQANRRRSEVRLRQVMAALSAMREDEYGECKRCGEEISEARLTARPEAPVCVVCQEALEAR